LWVFKSLKLMLQLQNNKRANDPSTRETIKGWKRILALLVTENKKKTEQFYR
jgi:hypothetical protein